jgi:heme A synthase
VPRLRWWLFAMAVLLIIQIAVGMVVNLFVTIPAHHPGADAGNYFTGSARSLAWALSSSPGALAVHASVGLVLIVGCVAVAIGAVRRAGRMVATLAVLAAGLVIGAAFNGASFLDFNHDISSLIMALLALAALLCYVTALVVLASPIRNAEPGNAPAAPARQPG